METTISHSANGPALALGTESLMQTRLGIDILGELRFLVRHKVGKALAAPAGENVAMLIAVTLETSLEGLVAAARLLVEHVATAHTVGVGTVRWPSARAGLPTPSPSVRAGGPHRSAPCTAGAAQRPHFHRRRVALVDTQ